MKTFIQELISYLGPEADKHLANAIGVDSTIFQEAFPLVGLLVLSGLKRQKSEHGGMDRVDHILNRYGSDRIFQDLDSFIGRKISEANFDSSLGGLLGGSGPQAADLMSRRFDLENDVADRFIPLLAPIVLGYLSHLRRQSGVGLCGISALLDQHGDDELLDDIPGSFLKNEDHAAVNSSLLAELLKGLTVAEPTGFDQ